MGLGNQIKPYIWFGLVWILNHAHPYVRCYGKNHLEHKYELFYKKYLTLYFVFIYEANQKSIVASLDQRCQVRER